MWYEKEYNTVVSDFGCIPHKTIPYLAASPDGINTLLSSERHGRMLEVKNIVNRDITGIPKVEYWIQMQIQMEVCMLNECDFLETRFTEYEGYSEFIEDGDFAMSEDGKLKGVVLYFIKGWAAILRIFATRSIQRGIRRLGENDYGQRIRISLGCRTYIGNFLR